MQIIGQIIGFIFAFFFLRLAYKLYANNKIPSAVLVAWASAFILLCSFQWFQGWAKSFIASNISSKLTALGEQVNTVQETTTEMHKQLDAHQIEIDRHQKELIEVQVKIREAETNIFNEQSNIKNQIQEVSIVQSGLNSAETNLSSQEKQISDVEYWVKNLYGKMTTEAFSLNDTNNVMLIPSSDNALRYIVRLSHAPIPGSVEFFVRDPSNMIDQRIYNGSINGNIGMGVLYNYNVNNVVIRYNYIIDDRVTNIYNRMPILNQEIWTTNGQFFILPPPR